MGTMKGEARRALGRALVLMAVLAGLSLALPALASAGTIMVTTVEDEYDTLPNTGCALREAVQVANNDGSVDFGGCQSFDGMSPINEGPDTIVLANGAEYKREITGADEALNASGDLDIDNENLTIGVAGPDGATVLGGPLATGGRVFDIDAAVTATMVDLEISFGRTSGGGTGGGIRNNGTLNLSDSYVSLNTSESEGGGIENFGTANIANTTISGNFARGDGAGLQDLNGTTTLNNVTVAYNEADSGDPPPGGDGGGLSSVGGGTLSLSNTIVASNRNGPFPWTAPDCTGAPVSLGYNLIGDTTGCTWTSTTGDITGVFLPRLGISGENGGPTPTIPLLSGSPAIDAGNPATPGSLGDTCETADQRGIGRPQGARCDIGAFEATPLPMSAAGTTPTTVASTTKKKKCKKGFKLKTVKTKSGKKKKKCVKKRKRKK